MTGNQVKRLAAALSIVTMGAVLLSATAMADVKVRCNPNPVKITIKSSLAGEKPALKQEFWGNDPFCAGIVRLNAAGDRIYAHGCCSGGVATSDVYCVGNAEAGGVGDNVTAASDSNVVQDSIRIVINRSTPQQVKLTPTGFLKNLRHYGVEDLTSAITVAVYPDTVAANGYPNSTPIATGTVSFTNGNTPTFSGFFASSDWSAVTPITGGFQLTPVGNQETVSVPDANTAVVLVVTDPTSGAVAPASTPFSLALLALLLLGGAAWIMLARRRETTA